MIARPLVLCVILLAVDAKIIGGLSGNALLINSHENESNRRTLSSNGANGWDLNGLAPNALTYNALTANRLTANGIRLNGFTHNGISPNGIELNGLQPNGVQPNGLHMNGISPNGLALNGITLNGASLNGLSYNGAMLNGINVNGFTMNGFTMNGFTMNGINVNGFTMNGLNLNGFTVNGLNLNGFAINGATINGIAPNGTKYNGMTMNALTQNGLTLNDMSNITLCFDGGSNASCSENATICFDLTQPVAASGQPLTSQELALLVLASVDNNSSGNNQAPVPPVRFSDLVKKALMGANLPANMLHILSGAAGEVSQGYLLQFLNYTVSCALNPNQSLTIPLEPPVVLEGSLGVAQSWARRRINAPDQEAVSACLAARLNFFGVRVEISIRGRSVPEPPSAEEIGEFTQQEGAFWGNIFDEEPELFACTNRANVQNSYASLRFCSTGFPVPDGSTISCGPLRNVGPCSKRCKVDPAHSDEFRACSDFHEVLSVFLRPASP